MENRTSVSPILGEHHTTRPSRHLIAVTVDKYTPISVRLSQNFETVHFITKLQIIKIENKNCVSVKRHAQNILRSEKFKNTFVKLNIYQPRTKPQMSAYFKLEAKSILLRLKLYCLSYSLFTCINDKCKCETNEQLCS